MGYHDEYDRDYSSGRHSSQAQLPQTAEELRRNFQQNLNSVSNVHLETDEQGNASIMGISVPKNLKPAIEIGLENLKPFLIDQSDKIYHNASKLASRIPFARAHSNKIGVVTENVFRWGIIGAKQIFDAVHASSKYSKERTELFNTFSPVMQATGSSKSNNEVFKTAFDDIHGDWVADMKKMVADLPTLIPMVILGLQDQAMAAKKRTVQVSPVGKDKIDSIKERIEAQKNRTRDEIKQKQAVQEELSKFRDEYVEEQLKAKAKTIDHSTGKERELTRKELLDDFEYNIAGEVKQSLREQKRHPGDDHDGTHHDKEKDADKDKTDKMLRWAIPGASILTQIFKANIEDTTEKRKKRIKAWKMIEHLKKEMETQCGKINDRNGRDFDDCDRSFTSKAADEIRIAGIGNAEGENVSLKEFIVQVFQQHERDREPGRNFRDKNGKLIDPLKGTLLANLQPAVDLIAEHIADGSLSPDCLYKLVGENIIINHSKSGAKTFATESQVEHIIEKELLPVLSTREVVKMEEFMAKFADPALIQETLKKNLDNMKGVEKALFVTLFPDDILEQAGMRKKDIVALRKEAHQFSYDFVAANVIHFSAQNPEALKKMGVSDQETQIIQNLAEKIESGDVKALKSAVDGRNKEAIDAVRTAGLLEQAKTGEQGKHYWAERVKEMGAVHQKLKENESKFASENENGGGDQYRRDSEKKWASDKKPSHHRDHDGGDRWGSDENHGRDAFSSRFDPDRGSQSAKDRVRKGRESPDDSDMRVL